jgi:hypothetical protein
VYESWFLALREKQTLRTRKTCWGRYLDQGEKIKQKSVENYEKLHNLCSSPNTVRVIKSKRIRWVGHAAYERKI